MKYTLSFIQKLDLNNITKYSKQDDGWTLENVQARVRESVKLTRFFRVELFVLTVYVNGTKCRFYTNHIYIINNQFGYLVLGMNHLKNNFYIILSGEQIKDLIDTY